MTDIYNYRDTGTLMVSFNLVLLFLGQSLVSININSPIGKLLVLINQSFTLFKSFDRAEKANRYYDIK